MNLRSHFVKPPNTSAEIYSLQVVGSIGMPNNQSKMEKAKAGEAEDFEFPRDFKIEVLEGQSQIRLSVDVKKEDLDDAQTLDKIVKGMDQAELHVTRIVTRLPSSGPEVLYAIRTLRSYTEFIYDGVPLPKSGDIEQGEHLIGSQPLRLMVIARIILSLAKSLEETIRETVAGRLTLSQANETLASTKYVHGFLSKLLRDASEASAETDPSMPGTSSGKPAREKGCDALISELIRNMKPK